MYAFGLADGTYVENKSTYAVDARWPGNDSFFMLSVIRHRVRSACFNFKLTPDEMRKAVDLLRKAGGGIERWIVPGLEFTRDAFLRVPTSDDRGPKMLAVIQELLDSTRGRGSGMAAKPKTIDEYLAALSDDKRAALEKLRKTIKAAAPEAEECISYQIAAFRQNGMLVAFGATENHCAFYPMNSSVVETYKDELKGYDTSKGTIRFQPDKPLPVALVRKLVKARLAENLAQSTKAKNTSKKPARRKATPRATPKRGK